MNSSTVSRLANRFRDGCVSIDNDLRAGGPKTSIVDEISVELVTDALEEVRRTICKELSRVKGAKTSQ